jgi:polysaccharide biosynthesis/export protein
MTNGHGSTMLRQFRSLFEGGTVAGLTDGQLLERFLGGRDEGGEVAFAALVARHGPMVLGVCRRALADPDDAADAFQATFLILVKKARSVRVDDSLGRWLYGVSRKVASRARVVADRRPTGGGDELGSIAADSPDPDRFELLAMLDEELGRLPEPFRTAVVLCDLGGLTHEEAARDLLIPVGTIKSRLARARKKLRERLERRGLDSSALAFPPVVPASLVEATARISWLSAMSGGPSAVGVVPASSALLAREVLKAMTGLKLKLAASAVLSLGVVATGAGVFAGGQKAGDGKAVAGPQKASPILGHLAPGSDAAERRLIEVLGDRVKLDGKEMSLGALTDSLMPPADAQAKPLATVTIRVASDRKYSEVARVVEAIQDAGIRDIRFEPAVSRVEAKLEEPISLSIQGRPLADAIRSIRGDTGLNIILDPEIAGEMEPETVTLHVQQVKLKHALRYLLRPLELVYQVEDDVLIVTRPLPTADKNLAKLEKNLGFLKAKLADARRVASDPNDPAVTQAARVVKAFEAEIEKVKERPAEVREDPTRSLATSKPVQATVELFRQSFPEGHWTAREDVKLRYHDAARGLALCGQAYDVTDGGRRVHMKPFAMIWTSRDGKVRKTLTADQAVFDLARPFGSFGADMEILRPTQVRMSGRVEIRDGDKKATAFRADNIRFDVPSFFDPEKGPGSMTFGSAGPPTTENSKEGRPRPHAPARETAKVTMPEYTVEPPDILQVDVRGTREDRPIAGERLVRPDGRISLGFYGEISVAGLTTAEIKEKVTLHLREFLGDKALGLIRVDPATGREERVEPGLTDRVAVEVVAYNSRFYYVQGEVAEPGRFHITGNETVLDAINLAGGLGSKAATDKIQLVRPAPPGAEGEQVLRVDLFAIVNRGDASTNYQLMSGDRLVVDRDPKAEPAASPAAKPGAAISPEVEARFQALERKLDEILQALGRPAKP